LDAKALEITSRKLRASKKIELRLFDSERTNRDTMVLESDDDLVVEPFDLRMKRELI
jgi:hypothetical protein